MKTTVYFKQFLPALATLVTVGFASSCQDQNFDWDEAHASSVQEKFTNVFIKEFGKPQEGHDWGYNAAANAMKGLVPTGTTTRAYFKLEDNIPGMVGPYNSPVQGYAYIKTKPQNITDHEHQEVYAWFSSHKVNWANNPTILTDANTRAFVNNDATAYYFTNNKVTLKHQPKNSGQVTDYSEENAEDKLGSLCNYAINCATSNRSIGTVLEFHNGWVQRVASNVREDACSKTLFTTEVYYTDGTYNYLKIDGKYVAVDMYGNPIYKKYYNTNQYYLYAKFSSAQKSKCKRKDAQTQWVEWNGFDEASGRIWKKMSNNTPYGMKWENDFETWENSAEENLVTEPLTNNNIHLATVNINKAGGMDYLCAGYWNPNGSTPTFGTEGNEPNHTNDFNGAFAGPGYKTEYDNYYSVVMDGEFNNWFYKASRGVGDLRHDKFILVYLQGDDYAGYYLGFDYECWSDVATDHEKRIKADGICNDWIFKIGEALPTNDYNPCRIMCEDLGGDMDVSTAHPKASDIDYNDLVLDVEYNGNGEATLTLRAAGGTMPLIVEYDDNILFETHEFFKNAILFSDDNHKLASEEYGIMYRTGLAEGENATAKSLFLTPTYNTSNTCNRTKKIENNFDFEKLKIKVYRFTTEKYLEESNNGSIDLASKVTLSNEKGQAPLLLYLPASGSGTPIKWMKERENIKNGYKGFMGWVANSAAPFWTDSYMRDNSLLYGNGN